MYKLSVLYSNKSQTGHKLQCLVRHRNTPSWLRFKFTPSLHHVCTRTKIKFASCLSHVSLMFTHWQDSGLYLVYTMFCTYITLGLLIAFPRIQTDRIHQLTRFPTMITFRRALSWSILSGETLNLLPRATDGLSM